MLPSWFSRSLSIVIMSYCSLKGNKYDFMSTNWYSNVKCLSSCGHDDIPFLHYYSKLLWKITWSYKHIKLIEKINKQKNQKKNPKPSFWLLTTGWNYAIALKLVKRKIFRISFFLLVFLPPFSLSTPSLLHRL